jgi:hypothetical protein
MTYTANLTQVLRSLLDVMVESEPPERIGWSALRKGYKEYEDKDSRKRIQDYIRERFGQDQKPLDRPAFRSTFDRLLKASERAKPND